MPSGTVLTYNLTKSPSKSPSQLLKLRYYIKIRCIPLKTIAVFIIYNKSLIENDFFGIDIIAKDY